MTDKVLYKAKVYENILEYVKNRRSITVSDIVTFIGTEMTDTMGTVVKFPESCVIIYERVL